MCKTDHDTVVAFINPYSATLHSSKPILPSIEFSLINHRSHDHDQREPTINSSYRVAYGCYLSLFMEAR